MKLLQIHSFYDGYLESFYAARRGLALETEAVQLAALLDDGFSSSHLFAPAMTQLGVDARLVIGNCKPLQLRWCADAGVRPPNPMHWMHEIPRRQVEQFRPDVLYISDPITYDSRFVRSLAHRPYLVVGWRAAEIPPWVDLTAFDIILSHEDSCRKQAESHGAKTSQFFLPGFPDWVSQRVAQEPKMLELVFCGQITRHHQKRRELLDRIASHAESTRAFTPHFFITSGADAPCAQRYAHPALWGMEMHRAIKHGKVNLNVGIDLFRSGSGNMRQFEVTGTGSFLLAESSEDLQRYFRPGVEVETYSSFGELVEKVSYYLAHEDERETIAQRGHARCLSEHGMGRRSRELLELLERGLRHPPMRQAGHSSLAVEVTASPGEDRSPAVLLSDAIQALSENRINDSYKLVLEAQSHPGAHPWLLYIRAICMVKLARIAEALEDLEQELSLFPNNNEAKDLRQQLLQAMAAHQGR